MKMAAVTFTKTLFLLLGIILKFYPVHQAPAAKA